MTATPIRSPRAPSRVRPALARNEFATAEERRRESLWWETYADIEEHFFWVLPQEFQPLARARYLRRAAEFLRGAPRIVDYGCGNGWIARQLADLLPARITGLDFSPAQIALARSAGTGQDARIDFQTIDGPRALPPAEGYVFHGVLHHLPAAEIHDLLEQVQRLAPSGARLVFVEPTCFPKNEPTEAQQALLARIAQVIEEPAQALERSGRQPGPRIRQLRDTADERWWGTLPYGPSPLERPFLGDELQRSVAHYCEVKDTRVVQYLPASQAMGGELTMLAEDDPELARVLAPELLQRVDQLEQDLIAQDPLPDTGWYMQMITAQVR